MHDSNQDSNPAKESGPAYEKLMSVGADLIAQNGLDGINTNTIARAAHVGVGTFYNYFADKFAFHRAIVKRGLHLIQSAITQAHAETRERPIPEQARAGIAALVEIAEQNPRLFQATFQGASAAGRSTSSRRSPSLGLSPRPLEQRLRALAEEGRLDLGLDPRIAARAFIEMQFSCVAHWLEDPGAHDSEVLIQTLTHLHPAVAAEIAPS